MSVSNLIVRGGYGPTSTIPLLLTHGLGSFSTPGTAATKKGGISISIGLSLSSFLFALLWC